MPTPLLRPMGRVWVRHALRDELSRTDDVTVVIGVRERADYRLVNALRSIRRQTHPAELIRPVVVDYGSAPVSARRIERICAEAAADYVRVDDVPGWSRARCLNVGIRRSRTKFLLTSDVDIVFSPRYLSNAVGLLTKSPTSVVCSTMLDLPEESAEAFERTARTGEGLELERWKRSCRARQKGWISHPSICMSYTAVYRAVRGFDEYFEGWGREDDDLLRRFLYLGLTRRTVGSESFYLHQWHPTEERGRDGPNAERRRLNKEHFLRHHSILRNDSDWGLASRGVS